MARIMSGHDRLHGGADSLRLARPQICMSSMSGDTFGLLAAGGFAMLIWSFFRLPETRPRNCTLIDPASVLKASKTVFETREALGYVLGSGIIFGALCLRVLLRADLQ